MADTAESVTVDLDLVVADTYGEVDPPLDVLLADDFEGVVEWCRILTAEIMDANAQFAERRADLAVFQNECHNDGPEGKQRYFDEKAEYEDWRRRAAHRMGKLQQRLSVAKALRAKQHRDGLAQSGDAGSILANAIRAHRDAVGRDAGSEDDCRLWATLALLGWEKP